MNKKKPIGKEKSTMTEPQEEFVETKNVPAHRKHPAKTPTAPPQRKRRS